MATLTGNQVKDTYRSLLKLEDNGSLSANLKIIQDGIGNSTPLSLSTTAVVSSVNIEAPGFKTPGGTSAQYLRADGTVGAPAQLSNTDQLPEGSTNLYDKTVSITGSGDAVVTGTYPNFDVSVTAGATYTAGSNLGLVGNEFSLNDNVTITGNLQAAELRATGDVIAFYSSDRRLKDNIKPIENALEKVSKLSGNSFVWNNKQSSYKGEDIGVIAQEVEAVFPDLVDTRENGYKAVKYQNLVAVLIEAVKELNTEIKNLK